MSMIKCPNCHKDISDSMHFCPYCGENVSATHVDIGKEDNTTMTKNYISSHAFYRPSTPAKYNRKVTIVFIIIMVILALGFCASPLFRYGRSNEMLFDSEGAAEGGFTLIIGMALVCTSLGCFAMFPHYLTRKVEYPYAPDGMAKHTKDLIIAIVSAIVGVVLVAISPFVAGVRYTFAWGAYCLMIIPFIFGVIAIIVGVYEAHSSLLY